MLVKMGPVVVLTELKLGEVVKPPSQLGGSVRRRFAVKLPRIFLLKWGEKLMVPQFVGEYNRLPPPTVESLSPSRSASRSAVSLINRDLTLYFLLYLQCMFSRRKFTERDDLDLGNIQQSLALPHCEAVRSDFSITRRKF